MEDQRYVRYKKPENLAVLEEILQDVGIVKVEPGEDYGERIRVYEEEDKPYYEIMTRANAVIIKKLSSEIRSQLEQRVAEYNSGTQEPDRFEIELVSMVSTLDDFY